MLPESHFSDLSIIRIRYVISILENWRSIEELGAIEVIAPHDEGFGMVTTYADPQGNHFEIVELDYEFGA